MLNETVVDYAVKAGLALNCDITRYCKFDRKNYFYPDLPKAYQISQLYLPICPGRPGAIWRTGGAEKTIRIHEIHMEEDAGKLVHDPWIDQTRADYNRCGVPADRDRHRAGLPHRRGGHRLPGEAEVHAAVSGRVRLQDAGGLPPLRREPLRPARRAARSCGTRTEMKNLNSFKAIARAIDYEARRQIELLEEGKRVVQETRRWDENKDATYAMRSKENAQDYRYFPEPDIPPMELTEEYLDCACARSCPRWPRRRRRAIRPSTACRSTMPVC